MAEAGAATRAELIKLKRRIALAKNGHTLLKKKRDGLILEFFALLEEARTIRANLDREFQRCRETLNIARVLEGDVRVESVALAVRESPVITVGSKNIIGVTVPRISGTTPHTKHALYDSIAITEAAEGYENLLVTILRAAEIETSIRKLLAEIEKTKRRVNALEYEIIPGLLRVRTHILLRLDELERENFYRLKLAKRRLTEVTS